MKSNLRISFAAVLVLSAIAGGAARANPMPTSTDEARAQMGQSIAQQHLDATEPVTGPITSTDQARAQAGSTLPASPGAWVAPTIARNEDEGRAAAYANDQAYAGDQASGQNESVAANPSGAGTAAQGN